MNALKKKITGLIAAAVVATGVSTAAAPVSAGSFFRIETPSITVEVAPVHYKKRRHWQQQQQHVLNKKQIKRRLRSWGYRNFKKVKRKGNVYIVKASWQGNQRARLVVDAYSGWILKYRVLGY
ncbi:hypothetical protein [Pseudovibrio sp. Tun.PSC04-5.I4]|uniref:hypothetical protein n=1 Tax=Pseudovibrio sp. Tun.PSC04-5.I4 TaxID=1798213 RepID=UPI00088D57C6|nr:hypothetical protein [Pseudovibrio sp. Tun.PSC04-5.I4]SDR32111.1 hypothetical protein SAMN04515695_4464 [Pseudovibrio sp. Tun.PSC04-5.I4]